MPINNVGLLVYLSLGNQPLLVSVTSLWSMSTALLVLTTATSTSPLGNRGDSSGLWVMGRCLCVLEFYISVLTELKSVKLARLALIDAFIPLKEGSLIPS